MLYRKKNFPPKAPTHTLHLRNSYTHRANQDPQYYGRAAYIIQNFGEPHFQRVIFRVHSQ